MRSMCVAIAGCGGYSNEMKSGMIDYVLGVQTTKLMNFMAAGPRQCGAKREWPERTTIRFSALGTSSLLYDKRSDFVRAIVIIIHKIFPFMPPENTDLPAWD